MNAEHRKMCLSLLSGVDGIADSSSDDQLMSALMTEHKNLRGDFTKKAKEAKNLSAANTEMTAQLAGMNLSAGSAEPEGVLYERRLRVELSANSLVERGWDPATVKELSAVLLGTAEDPNAMLLSRADNSADCPAARVFDVLRRARPAPARGDQTASYLLSRENHPAGAGGGDDARKEVTSPYTGKKVSGVTVLA